MKRIIPIILILTLALALSACASSAEAPKQEENRVAAAESLPELHKEPDAAPSGQPTDEKPPEKEALSVTRERAIEIALADAGLKKDAVRELEAEYDREREGDRWEVDFESGKYEYSYEIDAVSGKILEREKELD